LLPTPKNLLKAFVRRVIRRFESAADIHDIPDQTLELFQRELCAELALEAGRIEAQVPRPRRKDPRPPTAAALARVDAI
jgi:hypothetical protein